MRKFFIIVFLCVNTLFISGFEYGDKFQEITLLNNKLIEFTLPNPNIQYTICIFTNDYKGFESLTKTMFKNLSKIDKSYQVIIFTNNPIREENLLNYIDKNKITVVPKLFNEEICNNYLYSDLCPNCMALLILKKNMIYYFEKSFETSLLNEIVKEF